MQNTRISLIIMIRSLLSRHNLQCIITGCDSWYQSHEEDSSHCKHPDFLANLLLRWIVSQIADTRIEYLLDVGKTLGGGSLFKIQKSRFWDINWPKGPPTPSEPWTFWFRLEAPDHKRVHDCHAHSPAKLAQKNKNGK